MSSAKVDGDSGLREVVCEAPAESTGSEDSDVHGLFLVDGVGFANDSLLHLRMRC